MDSDIMVQLSLAYAEPHRKFHTMAHISRMFEIAYGENIPLTAPQIMAIWFHDFVYSIPANKEMTNEMASAGAAFEYVRNKYGLELGKIVGTIVNDTETHIPTIPESEVVIDLNLWDLSIVERYNKNKKMLEMEMIPVYGIEVATKNRRKWLTNMVKKDKIYWSKYSNEKMECEARRNMTDELTTLGGPIIEQKPVVIKDGIDGYILI